MSQHTAYWKLDTGHKPLLSCPGSLLNVNLWLTCSKEKKLIKRHTGSAVAISVLITLKA